MINAGVEDNTLAQDAADEISAASTPWKLLIVDDEEQVHTVTKMALSDVMFDKRPLEFLSAYSEKEAREVIKQNPDLAILLLDVVMETDDAGLRLVEYVRNELKNREVRIIIRTGQAGLIPERAVASQYDINGFREKTELTADKLFSTVYTALSSYRDLHALNEEIVRRRKLEELQIEQTEELQKANTSLKQFASLASHDMKEPLRKILIFGERLEGQLGAEMPQAVRGYLDKVENSAERLTTLIEDLQTLSKLGSAKPMPVELDLNDILAAVLESYDSNIQQAGAVIEYENLPTIEVDKTSIELLFQNLLSNALKYRKPDTALKMHFSAEIVDDKIVNQKKLCVLRVSDNGIGIDPKYKERVFENFFRLHGKSIAGTGIGLALCKQLAELHNGSIEVDSEPGVGCTFTITLPVRQAL